MSMFTSTTSSNQIVLRDKINDRISEFTSSSDILDNRQVGKDLADLYSIFKTTEALEDMHNKMYVLDDEYTSQCNKLISNYNDRIYSLKMSKVDININQFFTDYEINCPLAYMRLVTKGIPQTEEKKDPKLVEIVAKTSALFVTVQDILQLDKRAVDELSPCLSDLLTLLNKLKSFPQSKEINNLKEWLNKLNTMQAHEEITINESRQMIFDVQASYDTFILYIESHK